MNRFWAGLALICLSACSAASNPATQQSKGEVTAAHVINGIEACRAVKDDFDAGLKKLDALGWRVKFQETKELGIKLAIAAGQPGAMTMSRQANYQGRKGASGRCELSFTAPNREIAEDIGDEVRLKYPGLKSTDLGLQYTAKLSDIEEFYFIIAEPNTKRPSVTLTALVEYWNYGNSGSN